MEKHDKKDRIGVEFKEEICKILEVSNDMKDSELKILVTNLKLFKQFVFEEMNADINSCKVESLHKQIKFMKSFYDGIIDFKENLVNEFKEEGYNAIDFPL